MVDLVGYSSIAKILEQNTGPASVSELNRQIQTFINLSLDRISGESAHRMIAWTGDGAIVFFNDAEHAHRFSYHVHVFAKDHTCRRSEGSAERWFRIGISTGEVNLCTATNQPDEYAGVAIANAKRLEASAVPGEIVLDEETFAGLATETRQLYGAVEIVPGKRDEKFHVRRCRVTKSSKGHWLKPRLVGLPYLIWLPLALITTLPIVGSLPPIHERIRGILLSSHEKHIAVLPLEFAAKDPENQAIGDGLMDSLAGKLANLDPSDMSLFVVPASEMRRRKVVDPVSAYREFGATMVIQGSFEEDKQTASLKLTVIDPAKSRLIGYIDLHSSNDQLASLEDEAIDRLGRLMNIPVSQSSMFRREKPENRAAYEDYLAGLGYLQRYDKSGNIELASSTLENAVKTDPQFALGYASLAQVYLVKYDLDSAPYLLMKAEEYGKKGQLYTRLT